jgi:UDP-N-acetylmuramoyl-L-alanyl-D-glutamate--2,6-diaminopimelate ligase
MRDFLKKIIPKKLFDAAAPLYHRALAFWGALRYGFPSKKITVIGVTGTKGKSSTLEFLSAMLEAAHYRTAIASTIRFKIGEESDRNLFKMTMPGRSYLQQFLRRAAEEGCTHALVEMTSEGAKQFRHTWIDLDALIVTNISPEHIESHGSYEKYLDAKLSIARALDISAKKNKILVVNSDDKESQKFIDATPHAEHISYTLADAKPFTLERDRSQITIDGTHATVRLPGEFNVYNFLAAYTLAKQLGVSNEEIVHATETLRTIPGRVEDIAREIPGTSFSVIIDYAHTPDSLEQLYKAFPREKKICVLSGTGGGRDGWKRPVMGGIADTYCDEIILTDEDPYDEDPEKIIREIAGGIVHKKYEKELDRRKAIRKAVEHASAGAVVLITGKGTDPYIMGAKGSKIPWSDADVAREEIKARIEK